MSLKYAYVAVFFCSTTIHAISWETIITQNKDIIGQAAHDLILSQYNAFQNNTAPIIADQRIKLIEIRESADPLIDIRHMGNERIKMLEHSDQPYDPDLPAAKMRLGVFHKLEAMLNRLDELASYFGYQPQQISIGLFEGLRDLKTQERIFEKKLQEIMRDNPTSTPDQAYLETTKWVSPVKGNIPAHSTGAAIDICLWDTVNNQFLDMGQFGVMWGPNPTAPTYSENITDVQKNNRLYAISAATHIGLINYTYEFWHFSYGDAYATFWTRNSERYAMPFMEL